MVVEGSGPSVWVTHSDDGATWSDAVSPTATARAPAISGPITGMISTSPASLAVDRSTGPHAGRVYATWFDHAAGNGDVKLSWSDDGATWAAPILVNDDGGASDQHGREVVVLGARTADQRFG